MNIQNILYPTDFSSDNDAALGFASALAAESGAVLHIVHVDDGPDIDAGLADAGYPYTWSPSMDERSDVRERFEEVVPPNTSVRFRHHYVKGTPVSEIVKLAEQKDADLIVMASHGRRGLSRFLMGSIAEGVLRRAACPVLVVKQPTGEREPVEYAASQSVLDD